LFEALELSLLRSKSPTWFGLYSTPKAFAILLLLTASFLTLRFISPIISAKLDDIPVKEELKKPLKYIGFNGTGHQVRDALHPKDLVPLLSQQIMEPDSEAPKIVNLGGGIENCMSLKELSNWCEERFGSNEIISSEEV
jgi:nucleoside-diphosphate-sugar epimerase